MPESWFLPLDIQPPVKAEHLHAALSTWFDVATDDTPDRHHDDVKPYTISPPTQQAGRWGVDISTITTEASWRLQTTARSTPAVRLGTRLVRVGRPSLTARTTWEQLVTTPVRNRWTIDFLTPTTFRTGQRASPLPIPTVMLRGPISCWDTYSGMPPRQAREDHFRSLWVSELDCETVQLTLNQRTWPAVLGHVEIRCDDPKVSAIVTPLFALAPYCGVGSFKAKGLGVVRVRVAVA